MVSSILRIPTVWNWQGLYIACFGASYSAAITVTKETFKNVLLPYFAYNSFALTQGYG